jgi:hypothetical protein
MDNDTERPGDREAARENADWKAKYLELEQAVGRLYAAYNDVLAKNAMLIKVLETHEAEAKSKRILL